MEFISYVEKDELGIHARPAALIAQCCVNFKSAITIKANGKTASGINVLEILALGVKKGDTVEVDIEGEGLLVMGQPYKSGF